MDLATIEQNLKHADYQFRLKAIAALREQPTDQAVPLLQSAEADPEFLVRTFVARELGNHRTDASFATLLEIMRTDNTPNVRAEAANSLSLFGPISLGHLVSTFEQDDHWLVRRSILAALCDMEASADSVSASGGAVSASGALWEAAQIAIANREDEATRETAVRSLGLLATSPQSSDVLILLAELSRDPDWRIRQQAAYALKAFDHQYARDLLQGLRQDPDHRVVGAVLEMA
jgi:HEAT repeat protein